MMSRALRLGPWVFLAVLAAWVFWLRWPTFSHAFWNLDEGIYATVGRTIVEGGVMYRDAIDHRAPVCHYLTAAVFAVAGINNVWAMHATLAAQITLAAFALFLLGRQWRGPIAGIAAALTLAAFSTDLLYVGDAYSVSTEWSLAFFSAWATWWFWTCWPRAGFWGPAAAGAGYALAFMSKQPGLLEVGAPVILLIYLAATRRLTWIQAARVFSGLVTGFTTVLALIFAYFWANDTLAEFYFYGWTYNLVYYGSSTTLGDRLEAALALPNMLRLEYPLLLVAVSLAALAALHVVTRDRPSAPEEARRPAAFHLLCWLLLSSAGAASAGRIHAHYYIQAMPALALAVGWLVGGLVDLLRAPGRPRRIAVALALLAVAWTLLSHPVAGRARPHWGPDPGYVPARFIRTHTREDDRVFIWGLYPDFYVFAGRAPASRYIYTSFQTGVQPGKNTALEIDTRYATVHGALEALVRELEATRPVVFVDSSLGPQRLYEKYPLHLYPSLERFVREHYVEVDFRPFREQGFAVYVLKDSSRPSPPVLAGGEPVGQLVPPLVAGFYTTEPVPRLYHVSAAHPGGRLQRVELLVNGEPYQSVTVEPTPEIALRFNVRFDLLGPGRHRLAARVTAASGETQTGPDFFVECSMEPVSPAQRAAFALPVIAPGPEPLVVRAPLGAGAREVAGAWMTFAHAPSLITYPVAAGAGRITGRFAIQPGAYAAENTGRTDGAEFTITWIAPDGTRTPLLRRHLQPVATPADRGEHPFDCHLPAGHTGGTLEFAISAGPDGNAASDWTYWSDLLLVPVR